ncbi:MAG: hypothetical protein AAF991_00885, partial [Pseudomonadota bacterium]
MSKASSRFPGPRTRAELERGVPLFRNGLRYSGGPGLANVCLFPVAKATDRAVAFIGTQFYLWPVCDRAFVGDA